MAISETSDTKQVGLEITERRGLSRIRRHREMWGYIFISPWIIGFLVFTLIPIVATLVFAFTNYSPVTPDKTKYIGLLNFTSMPKDSKFLTSLMVTVRYGVLSIPVSFAVGLGLAALVNSKFLAGKNIIRTLFYMPSMIPVVAGAMVMGGVMNTQSGWINKAIQTTGVKGPDWLNSTTWIYPALVLIGLWGLGNLMLTLLAGMQGVPSEMYEAAEIDGASWFQRFISITMPMISPVIFYNLILMVIGAFKYFDVAYVLKNGTGAPADATLFYNLNLYKNAFTYNLMGYGSALAWVLFLIVLVLTVFMFRSSARWVFYAGESERS